MNRNQWIRLGQLAVLLGCSLVFSRCGGVSLPLPAERPMPYSLQAKWDDRIGSFTYKEMVAKKGLPNSRNVFPNGSFVAKWTGASLDLYEEYYSKDTLVLTFDAEGILSNWTYYR